MPSAFDGYLPRSYDDLGDDGDQSGTHAGFRHKDNKVRCCMKCKAPTNGEEAYVDGQIWCHPCADQV